jgi:hypothetical protein
MDVSHQVADLEVVLAEYEMKSGSIDIDSVSQDLRESAMCRPCSGNCGNNCGQTCSGTARYGCHGTAA